MFSFTEKNMRKIRGKKWGWSVLAGIVLGGTGLFLCTKEGSPEGEIEEVRQLLAEAEGAGALNYSPQLYKEARFLYDSAMISWREENKKWIVFRDYSTVRSYARMAKEKGKRTLEQTREKHQNSRENLQAGIDRLQEERSVFEPIFNLLPLPAEIKEKYTRGKLLLNEAEIAFKKGDYPGGSDKSVRSSVLVRYAYEEARKLLEAYFVQLPQWQAQLKTALENSRERKDELIVVEKFPPRCVYYERGEMKYTFKVEFGKNWIGDKRCEGDRATPEGNYWVERKLEGNATQYYKALLLNYPNREDEEEFRQLKRRGKIAAEIGIGGLIEIHGKGGRGTYWTNGCVALANEDMNLLYSLARKGTPILIIGSSLSLEKALKNYGYAKN